MANAFRIQMNKRKYRLKTASACWLMLNIRAAKNNRLKRLIRKAELEQSDSSIAAIDYQYKRKLNNALINHLVTCEYITEYHNIFVTGATAGGKTYIACAFRMEACKHYYTMKYVWLPDLFLYLQAARDSETNASVLKKYTKPFLLNIDEWLLIKLTESETRNLFELIHKRMKKSSTIVFSQFREHEWYQQICNGESTLADAIMDHISYDSYKINIESINPSKYLSMRGIWSRSCSDWVTVNRWLRQSGQTAHVTPD